MPLPFENEARKSAGKDFELSAKTDAHRDVGGAYDRGGHFTQHTQLGHRDPFQQQI